MLFLTCCIAFKNSHKHINALLSESIGLFDLFLKAFVEAVANCDSLHSLTFEVNRNMNSSRKRLIFLLICFFFDGCHKKVLLLIELEGFCDFYFKKIYFFIAKRKDHYVVILINFYLLKMPIQCVHDQHLVS